MVNRPKTVLLKTPSWREDNARIWVACSAVNDEVLNADWICAVVSACIVVVVNDPTTAGVMALSCSVLKPAICVLVNAPI